MTRLILIGLAISIGLVIPFSAALQNISQRGFWPGVRGFLASSSVNASPLQDCVVNCSATVQTNANINQSIPFTGSATTGGCSGDPSYEWDFGDTKGSSEQNPTHVYTAGGVYNWRLTVQSSAPSTMATINTVAGGRGEGEPALQVPFARLVAVARDPQNRGLYLVSSLHTSDISSGSRIVFFNTGVTAATIAGVSIAPGTVRTVAGGGLQSGENLAALVLSLGTLTGVATNPAGDLLYFTDQSDARIRVLNVSAVAVPVKGTPLDPGKVRTFAAPLVMGAPFFGTQLFGLAYQSTTNDLIVADASALVWKVYRVHQDGLVETVAGTGVETRSDAEFVGGAGTSVPLLDPRAVEVDATGNILIADTGHARVVRVASNGSTTLVAQFPQGRGTEAAFPAGIAVVGATAYSANGNQQRVVRATGGQLAIAGQLETSCDYTSSNCGDGGLATASLLGFPLTTGDVPIIGIKGETGGIYILDQTPTQRSRVRYVNLTAANVVRAGVTIAAGAIQTIAGNGLTWPFDGGNGTGASLRGPVGVAADAKRNLFIADTLNSRIRFLNRSGTTVSLFAGTPAAQNVGPGSIATINYLGGGNPVSTVPAHFAILANPQGLTVTSQGLYVADTKVGPFVPPGFGGRQTSLLRFINTSANAVTLFSQAESPIVAPPGYIATIAGGSTDSSNNGDGGFALNARFVGLSDVAVDANGNIYVTEVGLGVVRRINGLTGVVSSLSLAAGTYTGLGFGNDGRLFIVDATGGKLLRENNPTSGAFTQLAMGLGSPRDVAIDVDGLAIVTDANGHRVISVSPAGAVATVSGTTQGFSGDGGPAPAAQMNISAPTVSVGSGPTNQLRQTVGVAVTPMHEIFFADVNNSRVRRVGAPLITCTKTGTITIPNPVPTLTSISPQTSFTGGPAFTLTLNGAGFVTNSVARWNGSDRQTTLVGPNQLTAQITAADVANSGSAAITVFNPAPAGGLTGPRTFAINNPLPSIVGLQPSSTLAGSPGFELIITGINFVSTSVVRWNGAPRTTDIVNSTQAIIQVPAADVVAGGNVNITMVTPAPGGGTSGAAVFSVNNPLPTLSGISPNSITGGGPPFTLTVNGASFVNNSVVRWNDQPRPTTFISSSELSAQISAADISSGGDKSVTVFNPTPGGGTSNSESFTVSNPPPTLASLSPPSTVAGSNSFTLTVTGANFANGAIVRWNGSDRPTVFVDTATLTATIPATDVVNPGSRAVTVFNPPPSGGVSGPIAFTVTNPVPVLTSVVPDRVVAGSSDILITIRGSKFFGNSIVKWNGQNRVTTHVGPTELRVIILAGDIAAVGEGTITVFNPAPEGGASSPLPFTIFPPNPIPTIVSLAKTLEVAGGAAFLLTVKGTNFIASSQVQWNSVPRPTTFTSETELVASITASDIATAGVAQVTVFNPPPGGGTTNPLPFTIANAAANSSAASYRTDFLAPDSIVAVFGTSMAVGTEVASTSPLPFLLLGTTVQVKDSAGMSRQAPLFFVSPGQINYLLPAGTASGEATVSIISGSGLLSIGKSQISAAAPGIFSANSSGNGVAAANALRVVAGGAQLVEEVAQLMGGVFVPRCIDLGPTTDTVFLILYGTGIRGTGSGTATATIGGVNTPVPFAGAQGVFVGLDQINLGPIPRQLIGRKTVDVVIQFNGQPANTLQICAN